jgi:hypothetical protein
MGVFCHTSVRQTVDFAAPEFKARLIFLKKEKTLINVVVGECERIGGAAKMKFFQPLFSGFSILHL